MSLVLKWQSEKKRFHYIAIYCSYICKCIGDYNIVLLFTYYFSKISGTHAACGLVAGAAALVLGQEKFKHYTPAEVKQHLLDKATDGVVEIPKAFKMFHGSVNKFLYVGTDNGK